MADPYKPNRRLTSHISSTAPATGFIFSALVIYLGWFLLRQALTSLIPPDAMLGQTRFSFLLNLSFFVLLFALTVSVARRSHRLDWRAFLGDQSRLVPDFARTLLACLTVFAIIVVMGFDPFSATSRPLVGWLAFLPIALLGILIQTGAEELYFRGFLHHFCSTYLRKPVLWLLIPSVAFGLTHMFNDTASGATMAAYVVWASAFGLACIDLTARTGSLGAAWGLHMAVNVTGFLIAAPENAPMSGGALFLFPERTDEFIAEPALIWIATIFELFFLFVLWLAARNAVER
ncbi:MAG: CPBP family intramembrane glutamic endopeptidase [Pseudomonadota bacterium]